MAVKKALREADMYISPILLKEYRDTPVKLMELGKINHQQLKALITGIQRLCQMQRSFIPTKNSLFAGTLKITWSLNVASLQKLNY